MELDILHILGICWFVVVIGFFVCFADKHLGE